MNNKPNQVTPPVLYPQNISKAKRNYHARTEVITGAFRSSLLVGSNALLTLRMLDHLQEVAEGKEKSSEDASSLRSTIGQQRVALFHAVGQYEEPDIHKVQADVEQIMLAHNPLYLEGEEARRISYMDKNNIIPRVKPTWATNPSYRFVSLMKGDPEGATPVTEEEQRSCISKCSWSIALIGLAVALAFLIVDYWTAQTNPALSTTIFHQKQVQVPTIFACLNIPAIPLFANFPSGQYHGYPLWGFRSYTDIERNESFMFPKTMEFVADETYIGNPSRCEEQLSYMSRQDMQSGISSRLSFRDNCYSCLRIGNKRPIELSFANARNRQAGVVTLEFGVSTDLEFCLRPRRVLDDRSLFLLNRLLTQAGKEMVQKGIIEVVDPNNATTIGYALWRAFSVYAVKYPTNNLVMQSAMRSVFCNLYLFSGHFFPVKPGTAVRYKYTRADGIDGWKQVGNPANFLTWDDNRYVFRKHAFDSKNILNEMRFGSGHSSSAISISPIDIYALSSNNKEKPSFSEFAGPILEGKRNVLMFSKRIDDGVVRYSNKMQSGEEKVFAAGQRFARFNLSLDYESFETLVVVRRPTTSTAEFFTDVFEYIGLFTGICAYSVLVSPARMYLKRLNNQGNSG